MSGETIAGSANRSSLGVIKSGPAALLGFRDLIFLDINSLKLSFKKNEIVADKNLTKRDCFACFTQLWDPVGLVTPAKVEMRIDLQELWSAGYPWDKILPAQIPTK